MPRPLSAQFLFAGSEPLEAFSIAADALPADHAACRMYEAPTSACAQARGLLAPPRLAARRAATRASPSPSTAAATGWTWRGDRKDRLLPRPTRQPPEPSRAGSRLEQRRGAQLLQLHRRLFAGRWPAARSRGQRRLVGAPALAPDHRARCACFDAARHEGRGRRRQRLPARTAAARPGFDAIVLDPPKFRPAQLRLKRRGARRHQPPGAAAALGGLLLTFRAQAASGGATFQKNRRRGGHGCRRRRGHRRAPMLRRRPPGDAVSFPRASTTEAGCARAEALQLSLHRLQDVGSPTSAAGS